MCRIEGKKGYVRGIGLENICNASNEEAANESVVPDVLPAFLLVLLAGLDTEQPAGRRIIVATVVATAQSASGRESLNVLRPAQEAARAEELRYWSSGHLENEDREVGEVGKGGVERAKYEQGQQLVAFPR